MELKTIHKPELIVIAALMLLAIAGTVSAATSVPSASPSSFLTLIYDLLWEILIGVILIASVYSGLLTVAAFRDNNPQARAKGVTLFLSCIGALLLVLAMPWALNQVGEQSTMTTIDFGYAPTSLNSSAK